MKKIAILFFSFFVSSLSAQISEIEYFYDSDPGYGNGYALSFSQSSNVTLNFNLNIASLSNGIHSMYVRAKDVNNKWSLYTKKNIYIIEGTATIPNITQLEYFWNSDPGLGLGNQISISNDTDININFVLDLSNISQGVHSLYVRAKDEFNHWSLYSKKNIYIIAGTATIPNITQLEYFWDTDPGLGQATPVVISANTTIDENFVINIANMDAGIHSLYIRAKDMYNNWSLYTKKNIFIVKGSAAMPDVTELEYFFDTDPGFGAGTSLPVTASNSIDESYTIPLTNLVDGDHELYIRARDSYSKWSLYSQHTVHIGDWGCVYTDVDVSHTAYTAVQDLCARGLLENDGKCEPDDFIQRDALAKLAYLSIELQNHPTADIFPSPFNDLRNAEDTWYYSFAKNLAYLEFDDHKAPFDRNFFNFRPSGHISKAHTLKVLLEAFNIDETNNSGNTPFLDENLASHEAYNYIVKAYDLGIIDDTFDHLFKPNDNIYRREVFEIAHRMLTVLALPLPTITDDDFFEPGNYTPENFASFAGLHSGNFNHYTKTSFAISSVGIPLGFEHTYNSYLSEMPKTLIPLQPLGKMWNHTYNSYLKEIPGDVTRLDDFRVVVALPNSGFHIYKKNGGNYTCETKGVFNILRKPTADKFTITTKKQLIFTYQKIASSAEDFPFVLVSIHDRNGNTIAIRYEDSQDPTHTDYKRVQKVIGTAGRELQFTYYANSDLIHYLEDPLHRKVYFTYDTDNRLATFKDAKNQITHYNYGATDYEEDLLMTIQLPKGNIITNTYDKKRLASSKTNGNNPTHYDYDPHYAQTTENNYSNTVVTDPNNIETTIDFTKFGKPNKIVKESMQVDVNYDTQTNKPNSVTVNGKNAGISYDDMGNVLSVNMPMGITYTYEYNENNDIKRYIDAKSIAYNYSYNYLGNLTQTTIPGRGSIHYSVNSKGLVTSVTNPESITTNYRYDNYGNIIQTDAPEGITTYANYDIVSRLLSFTNPNNVVTSYTYDNNDNLVHEQINGHPTNYSFDANDNLIGITNANNKTTVMTYDFDADFLNSVNFGGATDAYTYYGDGKLHTYDNPNGDTFTNNYDPQGRIKTISTSGDLVTYDYDTHNNVIALSNSNGGIIYGYDLLNRITSTTDTFGNVVNYEYDNNSNVTKIIYPDTSKFVVYTYYDDNLLHTVTDWNANTTSYTYRNDGLLSVIDYPNGTHCNYSYDGAGRMIALSWKDASNTVINEYTISLDPLGNHLSENKVEPFTASGLTSDAVSYTYNDYNKLQNANGSASGNSSFSYDNNGNTITKTGNSYVYDNYNRLTNVSGAINAQYEYDASGNRRKSIVNGQEKRFVLDILGMSRVLLETDATNTSQKYYVYGLGLISRIDNTNQTRYYHYDFRGNTIAMTDENHAITHEYEYNDFGQTLQMVEEDFNPYRYVGKYGVAYEDTNLYFMRARYYDPSIGRFLSEDPIWSTNLYPYADNNPISFVDPKGTSPIELLPLKEVFNPQNSQAAATAVVTTTTATKLALLKLELSVGGVSSSTSVSAGFITVPVLLTTTAVLTTAAITTKAVSEASIIFKDGFNEEGVLKGIRELEQRDTKTTIFKQAQIVGEKLDFSEHFIKIGDKLGAWFYKKMNN